MTEAVGEALGIHGDEVLSEVEAIMDQKLAIIRNELAGMVTTQIAMVLQQTAQLRADTETKMTALRKGSGTDDSVVLANPLSKRERKTREQQSIQ